MKEGPGREGERVEEEEAVWAFSVEGAHRLSHAQLVVSPDFRWRSGGDIKVSHIWIEREVSWKPWFWGLLLGPVCVTLP